MTDRQRAYIRALRTRLGVPVEPLPDRRDRASAEISKLTRLAATRDRQQRGGAS